MRSAQSSARHFRLIGPSAGTRAGRFVKQSLYPPYYAFVPLIPNIWLTFFIASLLSMALGRESISLEDIPFFAEVAITSSHEVDNGLPNDSLNEGPEPNLVSIKQRLYTSHFLSTWNSRVFEFGAVLFLANLFPDTLLYSSVYALGRAASAICFSPSVGSYMDRTERLKAVRISIVGQRLTVVLSSVVLWVMSIESLLHYKWLKLFLFGIVCSLACVEKLCAVLNMIAVERDWVIVIAENTECELETLDCEMRRIDLFCKLVGPLAIALVDGFSTRIAIWTVMILSGTSVLVEYFTIAKVNSCVSVSQYLLY